MPTKVDDRVLAAALTASDEYVRRSPSRSGALYLADQPLRVGAAGIAYRTSLHASGGTPPYRFSVTGLPAGLGLQGSTVTGTPQAPGSRFTSLTVRTLRRTTTRHVALTISRTAPRASRPLRPAGPVDTAVLTHDGNDAYRFSRTDRTLTASAAPGNRGSSLRTVIVPRNAPSVGSAESCARWTSASSGDIQQGAALQVRIGADGRVRALTVTKNITYGSYWAFNLHTFDTARAIAYVRFGQVVLSREFLDAERVAHLPWGLCARVRRGYLEFKAWPTTETEPAWGDPLHGGRVPIPAGWDTRRPPRVVHRAPPSRRDRPLRRHDDLAARRGGPTDGTAAGTGCRARGRGRRPARAAPRRPTAGG